ncbi:MAG: potassium/proton antiporter [Deltaproteobacteria bacterium]|nr:potassium/proton antiporter [Deltaproteobacteria bacterium]
MAGYLESLLLVAGILLLLGVAASRASSQSGIPALSLFLLIGMAAGSEGFGGIHFDDFELARSIGTVALIFILFAGGLETNWRSLRRVALPGTTLATFGVVLTGLLVGFAAVWIFEFPVLLGLLLGAVVSSTDAAAVFGVLRARSLRLKGNLAPLLELESGANDPMAIFLTTILTALAISPSLNGSSVALILVLQLVVGIAAGYICGLLTVEGVNRIRLDYEGLYPVITIGAALLTYSATALLYGSGFLAVYVAGVVIGKKNFLHKASLTQFHDGIAWLMQIVVFLFLGLLVFPSQLGPIAMKGLLLSAFLVFVARPAAVLVCQMWFRDFNWRENLFISWVGLRGAVPIVLATIPITEGVPHAVDIFNIVFFVVLVSVLLQGTTIRPLARLLGVLGEGQEIFVERRVASNMFEVTVQPDSGIVKKRVVDLNIPQTALIVLLTRGNESYVPRGATVIEAGDKLLITSRKHDLDELRDLFERPLEKTPDHGHTSSESVKR